MTDSVDFKRILVTTDFSDYSKYVFQHASVMAEKFNAEIVLIHVIQPAITPADYAWAAPPAGLDKQHEDRCREALIRLTEDHFPEGIRTEVLLVHGAPFKEIIKASRDLDIDLIVMATHGLGGLSHVLFGSTSEKVVRKSPCPVFTVRHPDHKFEMP